MNDESRRIQNIYLSLTLFNTLATSLIWGINTLFLLDAGLSNVQAFAANAFFTVGQVLFEIPTGIAADALGRRFSYLLGAFTLGLSTLLYLWGWHVHAPFEWWAVTSMLLGLGYTFFSGATEAWLVDALKFTGFKGGLESVFAKSQIVGGIAMLVGSVSGGVIAQSTSLGVPYILRAVMLGLNFLIAFVLMKDLGFKPQRTKHIGRDINRIFAASLKHGFGNSRVRWVMLTAPFMTGVGFYVMYAMQPFLLQLYGDPHAYAVAGVAAAIIAASQVVGGMAVPYLKKILKDRTSVLVANVVLSSGLLLLLGSVSNFWIAIGLVVVWGLLSAVVMPVRQAYLNDAIPSDQRATVLSFDSSVSWSGGIVFQPMLGKAADMWSYSTSMVVGAGFQLLALPFALLAKKAAAKR